MKNIKSDLSSGKSFEAIKNHISKLSENNNEKVFFVCDSQKKHDRLSNALEYSSYQVVSSSNTYSALIKILEIQPSLILLDFVTANKDDYKIFEALKSNSSTSDTPIIFMVNQESLNEIPIEIQWKASDFIITPFIPSELEFTFDIHLDKKTDNLNETTSDEIKNILNLIQIPIFIINNDKLVFSNINYKDKFYSADKSFLDIFPTQHHIAIKKNIKDIINYNKNIIDNIDIEVFDNNLIPKHQKLTLTKYPNDEKRIIGYFLNLTEHVYPNIDHNSVDNINIDQSNNVVPLYSYSPFSNVTFSKREKEVLQLASKGFNSKKIATELFISDRTVEKHRASLMNKFGAKNFIQVIVFAIKYNLIDV